MALSLASVHDALSDFALKTFGEAAGSPVVFRFDKYGSAVSEDDVVGPDGKPSAVRAQEFFSELVNRVPRDAGDGVSVVLTDEDLDGRYFEFLASSRPALPEGDAELRAAVLDAFTRLKAQALKDWEQQELQSVEGGMGQYRPAEATPDTWYAADSPSWTEHSLVVKGDERPAEEAPKLWRLRLSDEVLQRALQIEHPPPRVVAPGRLVQLREALAPMRALAAVEGPAVVRADPPLAVRELPAVAVRDVAVTRSSRATGSLRRAAVAEAPVAEGVAVATAGPALARPDFRRLSGALPVRDRLLVRQLVTEQAPTEPVRTDVLKVRFEYCLVHVERPWWADSFVANQSWCVPTVDVGGYTDPAKHGTVPYLPVAVLAVRKLEISANWTGDDATAAADADGLGPFAVEPGLDASGSLTHQGIQTVGWLLRPLGPLPPCPYTPTKEQQ